MSENPLLNSSVADRVSALRGRFIHHERFEALSSEFYASLNARLADLRACRVFQIHNISLVAESGSGKTTAINKLIEQSRNFLQETDFPEGKIIQMKISSKPTFKSVGLDLLKSMEPNLKPNRETWYIWNLVRFHLRENSVLYVHFDEAQHLNMRSRKRDVPEIVDAMKSISEDPEWPVGFVLSGTQELKDLLNYDQQLVRRGGGIEFEPLTGHTDSDDMLDLIENYAHAVDLVFEPGGADQKFGERIVHAAAYQFGLVIALTLTAIRKCLSLGDTTLSMEHFADAYQAEKGCDPGFNPFLITQFTQIDPRQMFTKEERIK